MVLTLGYWDIRAKGEPIRLMLEYLGVDYEMKLFFIGDPPEWDTSGWKEAKPKLDIKYPNLPYVIDGDVRLTESWAIMRYLARKHKQLYPETDEENMRCDQVQGALYDFRSTYTRTFYDRVTFEQSRAKFLADFPGKIACYESVLCSSPWLAGDRLMYVDFHFAEFLSCLELCFPGCLDSYKSCKAYLQKFDELKPIAAYKTSSRFKTFPILRKQAMFGGQRE